MPDSPRAIGEREGMMREHPLREPPWFLPMLALHRSSGQTDALRTAQRHPDQLRERVGLDPSPSLQNPPRAIARGDPLNPALPRPLAKALDADALLILTDVANVYRRFGEPDQEPIEHVTPAVLRAMDLPAGSMGPKVEAACRFVENTGGMAAVGRLEDSEAIIAGTAGTIVTPSGRYPYQLGGPTKPPAART